MAIDKNFARRFKEANDGLDRAFQIKNEPQTIYYFGLLSGMLATVLPEQEARALTSVNGMSLSASILKDVGFRGELEWPTDKFCGQQIFVAKN